MVLEKTLENPLDSKEIKPVHPKRNQPWIFIGRTDAEAEAPILWPPDVKSWLIGKDPDAEKDWRQEEKGMTEDEMFGWYHWLHEHEYEQAPGVSDGQGSLACCSPRDHKESDTTEWLNWTKCDVTESEAGQRCPQLPPGSRQVSFSTSLDMRNTGLTVGVFPMALFSFWGSWGLKINRRSYAWMLRGKIGLGMEKIWYHVAEN